MAKKKVNKKSRAYKRRKRRRVLFGVEIFVLLILVGCLLVYSKAKGLLNSMNIVDQDFSITDISADENAIKEQNRQGYETIALVGVDSRDTDELMNSDVMILACIDHNSKQIKLTSIYRDTLLNTGDGEGGDFYTKANDAYNKGGYQQFLKMVNENMDMNITKFATVNFKAVAEAIDLLGGLDVTVSGAEIIFMNDYCIETSKATGLDYEPIPELGSDTETATVHLNGVQAVSYSRIRYGGGDDFRRTSRQRMIMEKMFAKAKTAGVPTLMKMMETVLPEVTTNIDSDEIMSLGMTVLGYSIGGQTGFPFDHVEGTVYSGGAERSVVIPVTLENNVTKLHLFMYPELAYTPSETVMEYSNDIIELSGYGPEDIPEVSQDGANPVQQETQY